MDEQAEYGVAAHWKYKEGLDGHDKLDERLAWVSQLLENQRVSEDSGNLLHDLKSDLLPEEVFAFTPKGDVINLPAGANCIDFRLTHTRFLRDPGNEWAHGVVTVEALVELPL